MDHDQIKQIGKKTTINQTNKQQNNKQKLQEQKVRKHIKVIELLGTMDTNDKKKRQKNGK